MGRLMSHFSGTFSTIIWQPVRSFRLLVKVIRDFASSGVTRGRVLENIGAKRMFLRTSVSAFFSAASEMSTATVWMPWRTRSVMTPVPMLPAPMTPMVVKFMSGDPPFYDFDAALAASGLGVGGAFGGRGGIVEAGGEGG